jgi:hypothetical protein
MLAHQFRVLQIDRARVRLFFRDTGFREVVNQDFRLDLQFPRQLVNPDLIGICHSPLFNSAGTRARAFLHLQNPANNKPPAIIALLLGAFFRLADFFFAHFFGSFFRRFVERFRFGCHVRGSSRRIRHSFAFARRNFFGSFLGGFVHQRRFFARGRSFFRR